MSRLGRQRDWIRESTDLIPLPRHPYRDSALFYGVLAAILVGVAYATGGGLLKAFGIAAGFFVLATAFSWWRFREKVAGRSREERRRETPR